MLANEMIDKKHYDELLKENEMLKKKYKKLDKQLDTVIKINDSTVKSFFNSHIELERVEKRFNTIMEISDKQSKRLLTEIEEKEEMLVRNKLANISDMISMLAHQWRQPLSIISTQIVGIDLKISMNRYNLEKQEDRKNFLDLLSTRHQMVLENVNYISTIIDNFMNYFKSDEKEELVIASLPIKNALSIIKPMLAMKHIGITQDFKCEDEMLLPLSDIVDVVLSIVNNCNDNFKVRDTINPHITLSTKKIEDKLIIAISDNGGGISKDIADKIFDPYFSTKEEKNGTGLGLYINKMIIEEHCYGKLTTYNNNDGAVFEIELPIK